jgi:hypothetical protein
MQKGNGLVGMPRMGLDRVMEILTRPGQHLYSKHAAERTKLPR